MVDFAIHYKGLQEVVNLVFIVCSIVLYIVCRMNKNVKYA